MNKTKKVFLVILNWNGWKMTISCLESLANINTNNFYLETVVIDNNSTDDSVKKIEEYIQLKTKLKIHLLKEENNNGFAKGNNIGASYAVGKGADYVCLLNNDVRVDKNFLSELFLSAEKDENIGLISGKIYFEKGYEFHKDKYLEKELGKVIWYAGGIIDWNNIYGMNRGVDEVDNGQYDKQENTDFSSGCLMFIRSEIIKKIGLFDEKFYMYYEDTDFSQKARKISYKVIYCPVSKIWHLNAGSSGVGSPLQEYFSTRNRLLFGMRYASFKTKIHLFKESFRLMFFGREWQKIGVKDFYLRKFGKGSWK